MDISSTVPQTAIPAQFTNIKIGPLRSSASAKPAKILSYEPSTSNDFDSIFCIPYMASLFIKSLAFSRCEIIKI